MTRLPSRITSVTTATTLAVIFEKSMYALRISDAIGTTVDALDDNSFGFNVGAGIMGFFGDHVGMRGEIRYFRDINTEDEGPGVTVDLGAFDFWRASIGVVFR